MYDLNFDPHVIKNIVLSDKNEMNQVEDYLTCPISVIIINHDAKTYSKVRFDEQTIKSFESNLSKI